MCRNTQHTTDAAVCQPSELERVSSFRKCEIQLPVRKLKLAKAGFKWSESGTIICTSCMTEIDSWPTGEECPVKVHSDRAPDCPFLGQMPGNRGTTDVESENVHTVVPTQSNTEEPLVFTEPAPVPQEPTLLATSHTHQGQTEPNQPITKSKKKRLRKKQKAARAENNNPAVESSWHKQLPGVAPGSSSFQRDSTAPSDREDLVVNYNKNIRYEPYPPTSRAAQDMNGEISTLKENIEIMKEERNCKVCLDKATDTVFLPCGHFVCCSQCAAAVDTCPICRSTLKGTILVRTTEVSYNLWKDSCQKVAKIGRQCLR